MEKLWKPRAREAVQRCEGFDLEPAADLVDFTVPYYGEYIQRSHPLLDFDG